MKNVTAIGAGVGGIAAAARLAKNDYNVTVLEKNDAPGGRCGRLESDGHRFDTGATMVLMPEFFEAAFEDLGERMEDHLDMVRVDPTYGLHFGDGTYLELTSDSERMREQLEAIEPGSFDGFMRYIEDGRRNYSLGIPRFMKKEYRSMLGFLSPSNLVTLARIKALRNQYRSASRYFKDERLRTAFTFQNLYMGLSPYAAPATYSLIQYSEFVDGLRYPKGGMYSVVEALTTIAEKWGARFVYNAPVARIDVKGHRATGVTLEDGRKMAADVVLANADLSYVYDRLLPQDRYSRRIRRKKLGCSTVTFLWGMDERFPQFGTHNLFFAKDIRGGYAPLFDGRGLPEDPHFYVHSPTSVDPSMAPPGRDTLMVAIPSAHMDGGRDQDWDSMRDRARASVIRRLEDFGLDGIERHIRSETVITPKVWERRYNLVKGSTHGLNHQVTQMSYMRPHNRHARYRNLYFVGASTHPGTGLPNVLMSARFASERIMKDHGDSSFADSRASTSRLESPISGAIFLNTAEALR